MSVPACAASAIWVGRSPCSFSHQVQASSTRVTYRMEITGPAADTLGQQIGPEISGDFPQVLAALAERAEA